MDNPLTDEQLRAVATDEDAKLVLVRAGTGKSSVITGKIAHLIHNQGVEPDSILVLAFNREAARKIRERLPDDLSGALVSTFHSFAFRLLGEATGKAPSVSKLATDDVAYQQAIDGILTELMGQREYAGAVIALLTSEYAAYREPFQFETEKGYREYVRDADPRTLNGELARSMEELAIGNFLTSNGVAECLPNIDEPQRTLRRPNLQRPACREVISSSIQPKQTRPLQVHRDQVPRHSASHSEADALSTLFKDTKCLPGNPVGFPLCPLRKGVA